MVIGSKERGQASMNGRPLIRRRIMQVLYNSKRRPDGNVDDVQTEVLRA